ncbi:uncharacterized protein LOC114365370 isoform X1 [Ostrinia furnacalis]|uniref:uncharacterized protein LOC114365370 isoform X1 n=1 Tax=Ostrinia furnacalis TaxID=93504 RepID=UPI00103F4611|nr:uncharacterized protein LOC114365370 isoform X1 [Ostrinia furnacalis]
MARRHIYTGMYTRLHRRPAAMAQNARQSPKDLRSLANLATQYVWAAYNMMNGNYLALATVIAVVLLSFLIPDISQKIHATSELKNMKKVLNLMTNEVSRAEVACLTAADEICYLHCSMHDGATETSRNVKDLSVCTSHCIRPTMSEPVQVERKIGFFRRIFYPNRNTSHKEIAIMSYVYTNSFDAQKTINLSDGYDVLPSRSAAVLEDKL